jgi:hypothetical protein
MSELQLKLTAKNAFKDSIRDRSLWSGGRFSLPPDKHHTGSSQAPQFRVCAHAAALWAGQLSEKYGLVQVVSAAFCVRVLPAELPAPSN